MTINNFGGGAEGVDVERQFSNFRQAISNEEIFGKKKSCCHRRKRYLSAQGRDPKGRG